MTVYENGKVRTSDSDFAAMLDYLEESSLLRVYAENKDVWFEFADTIRTCAGDLSVKDLEKNFFDGEAVLSDARTYARCLGVMKKRRSAALTPKFTKK